MPEQTMESIRRKMWSATRYVERLTYEVETLRKDEETAMGEVKNAISLLIQDKLYKIENAVLQLSNNVLNSTIPEAENDWRLRAVSSCEYHVGQ